MINFQEKVKSNNIIDQVNKTKQDYVEKNNNSVFQVTTTENQNNSTDNNISTINLGTCETRLRNEYKINETLPLLIIKIDYKPPDTLIPIVGYEIYHPLTKEKLNLSYCSDILIKLNIPVSVEDNELFKHDPNSQFYSDNCFPYTTQNGTDIILTDRMQEYKDNNLSLCEKNCEYQDYDKEKKQSICECSIKNKMELISEIIDNPDKLSDFPNNQTNTGFGSANIITIKCTKELFSKEGLKSNISSYILLIFIFDFLLSAALFMKCGYKLLENDISEIISEKEKQLKKIEKVKTEGVNKNTRKKTKAAIKKKNTQNFPPKKNNVLKVRKSFSIKNYSNLYQNNEKDSRSRLKKKTSMTIDTNQKKKKKKKKENNIINTTNPENKANKIITDIETIKFNDYELNTFSYENFIAFEKRTCTEYYISLIKTKHPLIFAVCPIPDYNSIIIKQCIFCLSFSIYYAMNFVFFDDEMLHKLYEDEGEYDFMCFLPKIMIAFAISHALSVIIKLIFLSERNIMQVKSQPTPSLAYDASYSVKKNLVIKYIIFFIAGLIFLGFFWILLSSFGAVFQNTQLIVFENTLICIGFSFVYPFFINIFPTIFRMCSLSYKSEYLYKTSKILQIL